MYNLYKIIDSASLEEAPASIITPTIRIDDPSIEVYHKFGYWPKEDPEPPAPVEEEGYKIFDDGYQYVDDGNGGKIIKHVYRKLLIVDPGMPTVDPEKQEFLRDYWEQQEDKWVHVYVVLDIIDNPPEIDPEKQIIIGSDWVIDEAARTKTKVYQVRNKIDNPPVLEPGQQIIADRWEDDGVNYTHIYEVRFIVDNPPTLEPGQQIVEDWWDDDGTTRTHQYKVMFVVDNPPELQPGQEIIDRSYTDDEATNTRTYHYEVRFIVDNPPVLEPGQEIVEEHWEDDGTTRTHVYEVRFIVDNPPELKDNEFIYEDHWDDDGTTRTHVYDVWTKVDEVPTVDPTKQRVFPTEDWEDLPDVKQRKRVYIIKDIIDEKPADDPDGNFWWEKDGEEETDTQIIIKYKKVFKEWRILSKLKIEMAVFQLGKMVKFDAFLNGTTMTNEAGETASLKRFYDQANELAENHKLFAPYCQAAFAAMEITPEQGEALLTQCTEKTFIIDEGTRVYKA